MRTFLTRTRPRQRLVHTGFQVLSPKSLEDNPCNLNCWWHGSWDLPLHTESQVLSTKYDMDTYRTTFFKRWGLGFVLRVGSSKKLDPTLNKLQVQCDICYINNQDLTLKCIDDLLMLSRGSKVGTLPPCWDLLTWVRLGTHVTGLKKSFMLLRVSVEDPLTWLRESFCSDPKNDLS
jgi:hypothetical protein